MLGAFTSWARQEESLLPEVVYGSPRGDRGVNASFASLAPRRWRPAVRDESWDGLPAHCVGRVFPGVEALHGRGNRRLWRRLLDRYELHQVVCGYAVTGLPQALSGKRFVIWVATSMDGDKHARVARAKPWRRLLHGVQGGWLRRQERTVLQRAAWVLALSHHTRAELLELGAPAARTTLLRCPINAWQFAPAQTPPARPTVVWSGRHTDHRKNTPLLVRAFARIADKMPDARLLLIGECDAADLARLAGEQNLSGRVELLGPRPHAEMASWYRQATVFAIPSAQEGLGIAGLEAMACGLPVVSTRCGGPETFVIPGKTGFLVDVNDESQLADALGYLLQDETARRRMGEQARRLIEEEYSPQGFARQLREVYADVWPGVFPQSPRDIKAAVNQS